MTKEQQIEEITKIQCKWCKECNDGVVYCSKGCYELQEEYAKMIYNAGYRKQSEVLKEFAQTLKMSAYGCISLDGQNEYQIIMVEQIDKLLKEYEE